MDQFKQGNIYKSWFALCKVFSRSFYRNSEVVKAVQTDNMVYKTNRVHGLHCTAGRILSAVESDKPDYGHSGITDLSQKYRVSRPTVYKWVRR